MNNNISKYIYRIGEENKNTNGTTMIIVEYINSHNIIVEFQDEYKYRKRTHYTKFLEGEVRNPYDKTFFKVGFLGDSTTKNNYSFKVWFSMIGRCYNQNDKMYKNYGGNNVIVCEEWLCFENFEKWYNENYYEVGDEKMCLDKDILVKGNKIYSPKTCYFIPKRINNIFTKSDKARGNLPIGVTYRKDNGKYHSQMSTPNKRMHLGNYLSINDAYNSYKIAKESYIKQIANEYNQKYPNFPKKLYDAMYRYEVEITD